MQEYIDLGWHTVPLKGELKRLKDGKKTIPEFPKGWRERYQEEFNTQVTPLGGTITGKVSNIVAIDCDNENTWQLFKSLDPYNEFTLVSKGKGYPAGTLIYQYDEDLAESFSCNDNVMALDFYSNHGFIYLATAANKTKVTMPSPLPQVPVMPDTVKMVLLQIQEARKPKAGTVQREAKKSQTPLAPLAAKFLVGQSESHMLKIITPYDFRDEDYYVKHGYLPPEMVPAGRGSEYLSKVSAILGADRSIDEDLYIKLMNSINSSFESPMDSKRLDSTIMSPMLEQKASVNGEPIWTYDEHWQSLSMIVQTKRGPAVEAIFDEYRNLYYVVNEQDEDIKQFGRDSEMFSYLEAVTTTPLKKAEVKAKIPMVRVEANPKLAFGFNDIGYGERTLNPFVRTDALEILHNPHTYHNYQEPTLTLCYLDSLVPDEDSREYLLRFIKTKLTTFAYSPVILYFMGVHGSGKDVFVRLLENIIGNIARPTTREFLEMFNGWIVDNYFAQLDEYGNQLMTNKDKEEALGKIKAYTGKSKVQIRQMRTDGFIYNHNLTFIMTANRNPLMLEDGDRRIAFFPTPNKLNEQEWVIDQGGVSTVVDKIFDELNDFCYYLATEVDALDMSDYVQPPESEAKQSLIFESMSPMAQLCYAYKHDLLEDLAKVVEDSGNYDLAEQIRADEQTDTEDWAFALSDMANFEVSAREVRKALRNAGIKVDTARTSAGDRKYVISRPHKSPFQPDEE